MTDFEDIKENFPYLSCIEIGGDSLICMIQNTDDRVISYYDLGLIEKANLLSEFLALCNMWWYESNRKLPINIFIGEEIRTFRKFIKHTSSKHTKIIFGQATSLNNLITRKPKKRQIQISDRP